MKEIRVYVVNCDLYDGDEFVMALSNEAFMAIAEEQGTVYSLAGFEWAFNDERISEANSVIRILRWSVPRVSILRSGQFRALS